MHKIYLELRQHDGKLAEFAEYAQELGLYTDIRGVTQALRYGVRPNKALIKAYQEWRPGRLKTKDMQTYVERTKEVFNEIKVRTVKAECESIVEVLEEALKELTLAIKHSNSDKLTEVKRLLEEALYGPVR